jgi:peptide/nickel transport system permease protein
MSEISLPAEERSERSLGLRRLSLPRIPYWFQRVLQAVPVVLLIITMNFFLIRLAPGDMADVMAGESGVVSMDYVEHLRHSFGADQSVFSQYISYLGKVLQLDLGWSFRNGQPVATLILERLASTGFLMVTALAIAILSGCTLGMIAGLTRRRSVDLFISVASTIGFAAPLFWLGLMLIVLFSVTLAWLPAGGMSTLGASATGIAGILDIARHMVLPTLCLAIYYMAIYTRLMRASVLDISGLDFVRTARAKGASRLRTAWHHILPNSLLSMVTLTGLQLGALFSGSITIETVFAWPGLGQLALSAVASRDLNLLLGILLVSSIFILLVNLLTDLSYALLDPRVEASA